MLKIKIVIAVIVLIFIADKSYRHTEPVNYVPCDTVRKTEIEAQVDSMNMELIKVRKAVSKLKYKINNK
jgi:hypothetical protein